MRVINKLARFFNKYDQHIKIYKKYGFFDEHVKCYRNEVLRLKANDANIFTDFFRRTVSLISPAMLVFFVILLIDFLVYEYYRKQAYILQIGVIISIFYFLVSAIVVFIDVRKSSSIMYTWYSKIASGIFFIFYLCLLVGVATIGTVNAAKLYEELTSMKNQEDTIQGEDNNEVVNNKNSD